MRNISLLIGVICVSMMGCGLEGNCNYSIDKDHPGCVDAQTSRVCQADGYWENKQCKYGCDEKTGECIDGLCTANKCEDNTLRFCKDDKSGYKDEAKDCPFGCNEAGTECAPCTSDICKNDMIYRCVDGVLAKEGIKCPVLDTSGKYAGSCANGTQCKECDEGIISLRRRCISPTEYVVCEDGLWGNDRIGCPTDTPNLKYCEAEHDACTGNHSGIVCVFGGIIFTGESGLPEKIPCPGGVSCNKDSNGCGECYDGELFTNAGQDTKCENNQYYVCKGGEYVATSCKDGLGCHLDSNGKAVCNTCDVDSCKNDGSAKGSLKKCDNGTYGEGAECKVNDEAVSCQSLSECGECLNGSVRCSGNILQTCEFGRWIDSEICNAKTPICNASTKQCEQCKTGDKRCKGKKVQKCKSGVWKNDVTCTDPTPICDVETYACVSEPTSCTEGDHRCQYSQLQICESGTWVVTTCDNGCYDETQCNVCPLGQSKCVGTKRSVCKGVEWEEETCENGCMSDGTGGVVCKCKADTVECIYNDYAKKCTPQGKWENTYCLGGCMNNQCLDCEDGMKKCEDGQAFNCVNGTWVQYFCMSDYEHVCDNLTYSKATCKSDCTVGENLCKNGMLLKCQVNEHGAPWWTYGNESCKCTPGDSQCVDENSTTCNKDGAWDSQICEFGCDNDNGKCFESEPECTNGESKCEAGSKNSPMQLCVHGQYQIIECTGINDSSCTESTCSTSCDKDACVKIGSDSFLKFVCIEGKYNYQKYKICTDSACTVCG